MRKTLVRPTSSFKNTPRVTETISREPSPLAVKLGEFLRLSGECRELSLTVSRLGCGLKNLKNEVLPVTGHATLTTVEVQISQVKARIAEVKERRSLYIEAQAKEA